MTFFRNRRMWGWVIGGVVVLIVLPVIGLALASFSAKPPADPGPRNGQLPPCPDSPNCVSTFATDETHAMAPLRFDEGRAEIAWQRLPEVVESLPRAVIVDRRPDYFRAEFTSAVFRFVDDAEFLFDRESGTIHFRSASRVGRSDLGANRQRIQTIIERLQAEIPE